MNRRISCLTFLASVAVLTTANVSATGNPHPTHPVHPVHPTTSVAHPSISQNSHTSSSSSSQASSASRSSAGAASLSNASGGNASQHQTATGGVSAASTGPVNAAGGSSDNAVTVQGDQAARIPVPTAIAGGTNTTADCRYSVGGGGQAAVAGLSLGWGRKDKDCERRDLAEFMYARGNPDAGDMLMCRITELRKAFGEDCLVMLRRARMSGIPDEPAGDDPRLVQKRAFERGEHLK